MESHAEKAEKLFLDGYNCSQAVVGAFADEIGIPFTELMKMASSFGGGMGRMREVCGTVSGMFMVIGFLYGYDDPKAYEEKSLHYKRIQELAEKFKAEQGSIICRELLGLSDEKITHVPEKRSNTYYKKRPCKELVAFAAGLVEEFMKTNQQ